MTIPPDDDDDDSIYEDETPLADPSPYYTSDSEEDEDAENREATGSFPEREYDAGGEG